MLKSLLKVGLISSIAALLNGCGSGEEIIKKIGDERVNSLNLFSRDYNVEDLKKKELSDVTKYYNNSLDHYNDLINAVNQLTDEEKKEKLTSFEEDYSEELNDLEMNSNELVDYFKKRMDTVNNYLCENAENTPFYRNTPIKGCIEIYNNYQKEVKEKEAMAKAKGYISYDAYLKGEAKKKNELEKLAKDKIKNEAEAKKYGYSSVDEYKKAYKIYVNEYGEGSKYGTLGYFSLFSRHYHLANKYSFLTLKGSIEDYEKKQNIYKSYDNYEKLLKETAKGNFKSINDYLVAQRTISVDRNELGRVISRPSKYLGKIIKFKDNAYDYVMEFGVRNLNDNRHKFLVMDTIKMRGANWSKNTSETVFLPIDIYNKLENDFYKKTQKNIDGYYMQTNEIELLSINGSQYNNIFGTNSSSLYIMDNQTVLLVKKIKIYNRNLGTYETKLFNY